MNKKKKTVTVPQPIPKAIDLNNPIHQYILVRLTLMYYASGDVKDVYEDEELCWVIWKEFKLPPNNMGIYRFISRNDVSDIYEDHSMLRVTNESLPQPEKE